MPVIFLPLTNNGPIIEVAVGLSAPHQAALRSFGREVPPPALARMLLDTGASHSAVDRTLIEALGLISIGKTSIHTPSTQGIAFECDQYDVSIHLLHHKQNYAFHTLPVICGEFRSQGHSGLLGRDILKDCSLVYHGTAGYFSLSF